MNSHQGGSTTHQIRPNNNKRVFLVPESGGDAGFYFIQYIKNHYTTDQITVIAVDSLDNVPAKYSADFFVTIPDYSEGQTEKIIASIIVEHGVTDIAATFEHGLSIRESLVKQYNVHCTIGFDVAQLFKDKYETFLWSKECGVPIVDTFLLELCDDRDFKKIGSEYYLKPRRGSGSKMNFHCKTLDELHAIQAYINCLGGSYIIQPFVPGNQRSIDLIIDHDKAYYFTRKSLAMQGSRINSAALDPTEKCSALISTLVENITQTGVYNLDCIEIDGSIYLLEVNPRLGGGTMNSLVGGFDVYDHYLQLHTAQRTSTKKQLYYMNTDSLHKKITYLQKSIHHSTLIGE